MSQINSAYFLDALRADMATAWNPQDITYGLPQVESPAYPYAVVRLQSVPMQPAGLRTVEQAYQFELIFADRWGTDPTWNVEVAKQDAANRLIARLMANPSYAESGVKPQVLAVEFDESDNPQNPRYYVTVTFQVMTYVEALEA